MIKDHDHKQLTGESSFWLWLFPRLESIVTKEDDAAGGKSRKLAGHIFHPHTGNRGRGSMLSVSVLPGSHNL